MKTLSECKAFFQDVHMDALQWNDAESNEKFYSTVETMRFIYGAEFDRVEAHWRQETLNRFYSSHKN